MALFGATGGLAFSQFFEYDAGVAGFAELPGESYQVVSARNRKELHWYLPR